MEKPTDGLSKADIEIRPHHLLSTVCTLGGVECPLLDRERIDYILEQVGSNATLRIKLVSDADEISYFRNISPEDYENMVTQEIFNRKRDLDILQKLGLLPGDIRRARYLYDFLFQQIETPWNICAYDTEEWEGCPHAKSGAYEKIRSRGWSAVVYKRDDEDKNKYRKTSIQDIYSGEPLYIRSHHLMCMACSYNGGALNSPRPEDTIYEAILRIQENPDIEITLVEGCCVLCDPCDGYDTKTTRCVHGGGLIRDYKKDLDIFQKLGLMPGATMKAREIFDLLFEKIPSTRDVCAYGDGIVTANEWRICGSPEGNEAYRRTIESGMFPE
ncbi:hypothetical protein GF312_16830 [Candidatus Poribacteria bacterium]|nr:hypothetical protein [Candidatus Poribacteria bacterium]